MSEVEEILKRLQSHKGVLGVIIMNKDGVPIKTTLDQATTVQYCTHLSNLSAQTRTSVRDIDPTNELSFLRIRSLKHEILVAPHDEYLLAVIQNPDGKIERYAAHARLPTLLAIVRGRETFITSAMVGDGSVITSRLWARRQQHCQTTPPPPLPTAPPPR
eukprot:CAMPEP_0182940646 /NCGR_PEP_ID=MMETSP0105_2-20130417/47632_1 /TAXON_ID=81532 ORGANISM="Acanthoeca-like sp., Strain 10tr" /NCGR_SAMPLE_ID=MMETSP0105_2 /ASSEMBLY_ACC=CAM_ASM_000205 /LENGTH=159 /DNA_ID=CAMNT_0025080157 /DNA_START=63 /DNA_END=540 /DNA_ORIENTATION=+